MQKLEGWWALYREDGVVEVADLWVMDGVDMVEKDSREKGELDLLEDGKGYCSEYASGD
jgi:hypothetical protein